MTTADALPGDMPGLRAAALALIAERDELLRRVERMRQLIRQFQRAQFHLKGAGPELPYPLAKRSAPNVIRRQPERSMTWRVKGLGPCADRRKSGSHQTPCWREMDSNF